ncbi:MAG TPA: PadR family transcriptional regulator [Gammaproteobacteria bacterium]|nr:PadR family transcriptional regulator [Gammaproteobacteria bacterium]
MDVKDLCLGALTHGDATGYDLKKFFENTFSHCFLAGYGSIYPALAELEDEKLVSARTVPGHAGPSRKVYHLTESGRKAFLARLEATEPQHRVKSEFLVIMHFAHLLPPKRLDAVLDRHLEELGHKLALIDAYECGEAAGMKPTPGARFACGFGKAVMAAARDYIRTHRHDLAVGKKTNNQSTRQAKTRGKASQAASRNRGYTNA